MLDERDEPSKHEYDLLQKANKELVEVARRSTPSVLRKRKYEGMSAEGWMTEILEELSTRCPTVNNILSTLLESSYHQEKKNPAICLIYGIIGFLRCHELSRVQRINSVLLTQGQATVNVSTRALCALQCALLYHLDVVKFKAIVLIHIEVQYF